MEISASFVKGFLSLVGLYIQENWNQIVSKFNRNLVKYKQIKGLRFPGEHQEMVMFSEGMQEIYSLISH